MSRFDPLDKGISTTLAGLSFAAAAERGVSVPREDLPLPLLVLKQSAVAHNIALLQRYCDERNVLLAPHGKTTMSPDLFRWQIEAGAWGITVATVQQALVCRAFGVQRVVLANQMVGAPNLGLLAEQLNADPQFELYLWVDSAEGVAELATAHRRRAMTRPWRVLLEVGWHGGRTGVQSKEAVAAVMDAIASCDGTVQLVGVSTFEGLLEVPRLKAALAGERESALEDEVVPFLEHVADLAATLHADGLLPDDYLLSGGGSASFDKVATVFGGVPAPVRTVVRSGCYVAHDHLMYDLVTPLESLRPALELWTYVTSIPEPGLAFVGFGKRDAPYDHGLPVPLARLRPGSAEQLPVTATITDLHDQHAALSFSGDLEVGDRVVLGISHPCTAFDRWKVIPVVNDEGVVIDAVETYF